MLTIREGSTHDVERVNTFYVSQRRGREAKLDDVLLLVENDAHEVVGAVRLCLEESHLVLRGMLIERNYRQQGLGTQMLHRLEKHMRDQDCYCLPWTHLETFYGKVGFKTVDDADTPDFLRERLAQSQNKMLDPEMQRLMQNDLGVHPPDGLAFMVMKRPKH